jgi:hypothetical protein
MRYDYLWLQQAAAGMDQGKDRPSCLVATSAPGTQPRFVVILPITHSNPTGETVGIEIPERVRRAIGLDDSPCWVIVSEHNVDEWPNGGLQPLPGRPGVFSYGHMPPGLFASIKARFIELAKRRPGTGILR